MHTVGAYAHSTCVQAMHGCLRTMVAQRASCLGRRQPEGWGVSATARRHHGFVWFATGVLACLMAESAHLQHLDRSCVPQGPAWAISRRAASMWLQPPCGAGCLLGSRCTRQSGADPVHIVYRSTGLQVHRSTGPQDHRSTGPQVHRSTGPQDHNAASHHACCRHA